MCKVKFILIFLLISSSLLAQDSLEIEAPEVPVEKVSPSFKPLVGFGIGTLTFAGDLGNGYKSNSVFSSSPAFSFHAQMPVSSSLNLTFTGIRSKITVNEPGLNVLNNFQSEINGGSALVTYNFSSFLNKSTFWRPYLGTGIASFEFLSKADYHDSNGLKYYLWSNGTLMSMAEDASNAHEAVPLQRDFVYETDLRGLNTENKGEYSDNSIAIPLTLGLDFKFSERFKGSLGTTFYYSLNDQIDNVSEGNDADDSQDILVHSSLGFSYDLSLKSKKKSYEEIEFEDDTEMLLSNYFDSDLDGINDLEDDCLGHPEGIEVDERGCPLDGDEDGVPDFRDDDPITPAGTLVDEHGVAIEDDDLLDKYIVWIDSLGAQTLHSKIYGDKPEDHFAVLVMPDKDGFNQDEINRLLSEEDVRQKSDNSEDGYLVGNYENFNEAISKQKELEENGIAGNITLENDSGEMEALSKEESERLEAFISGEQPSNVEKELNSEKVVYRVQVGAFEYDLSNDIFKDINDLLVISGDDGLTRYMTDSYENPMDAARRRVDLLTEGFEGSFLTAYKNGKRIRLSDAGLHLKPGAQDLIVDEENNSINPENIKFQVCLGEFEGEVPTEALDVFIEMDGIQPVQSKSIFRFLSAEFDSLEAAEEFLEMAKEKGLETSSIVGTFNGKELSLEEALEILKNSN